MIETIINIGCKKGAYSIYYNKDTNIRLLALLLMYEFGNFFIISCSHRKLTVWLNSHIIGVYEGSPGNLNLIDVWVL